MSPTGTTASAVPSNRIVLPCARGCEALLADEVTALGATEVVPGRAQVTCTGDYTMALRICMWSRVASRVLWPIGIDLPSQHPDELYAAVREIVIDDHLAVGKTFAIACTLGIGTGPETPFAHSHFVALRVKDAIVDRLRETRGARPDVDREFPDLRLAIHVSDGKATLSVDLAGEALHRRGYRLDGRTAPLKENLAAALLLRMGWAERAANAEPLCDPMCGSGTLLVEAGLIAGDRAPGLLRQHWGFTGWAQHDEALWAEIATLARERARAGLKVLDARAPLMGLDEDPEAVAAALKNAKIAGLEGRVSVHVGSFAGLTAPEGKPGLLITNPPYGERLGELEALTGTYRMIGDVLRRGFPGWTAGVFTAHGPLPGEIGLRPARRDIFWNGPIECRLLTIPISATAVTTSDGPGWRKVSQASEMFGNRVKKNLAHLGKWAKRERISCYRVYDADLPEYSVAVDLYEGVDFDHPRSAPLRWAHVQEYQAPATVDEGKAERRLSDIMARLPEVLQIPEDRVVLKVRKRQRGRTQYEANERHNERLIVMEGGHQFVVNLRDYLDTGLFLDQRNLRARIGKSSQGKRVLNLFCYTGSATVYAARAGAVSTTSVDLSNTYLTWAEDNFGLNELDPRNHRLVQDDCLHWMEAAKAGGAQYDVIFLAPPTFSNSKRMEGVLDVQRDHTAMLASCAQLLSPNGEIFFIDHFRRFKMNAPEGLRFEELTKKTLPLDFSRDARFHNAWRLTH